VEGLAAAIALSTGRIDLTRHEGVHPRVGATDVVPFVRFDPADPRPEQAARSLARRIAMLGVPAIGYGALGGGLRPAAFRAGGPERLGERMAAGEVVPVAGPDTPHRTAGVVLLGVRAPLVAFNVDLDTDDVGVARAIAAAVRERDGGLPGGHALGLPARGGAQVSTNLIDVDATPLHRVTAEIVRLAGDHGVGVRGGELVGLMPASVMAAAAGEALLLPGMAADRALEVAAHGEFGDG
jgi:glutamate formiminotransferase